MNSPACPPHPWLSRYAKLVVAATFGLIFLGGMVTSKDAGLSVPDWPTSYGYSMFTFPLSRWVGGIFFEHLHRLVASGVGLLTMMLCISIWRSGSARWLRWLGLGAFLLVGVQGVLGGLRVTKLSIVLAMVHACTAQLFLAVLVIIAAGLSPRWTTSGEPGRAILAIRVLSWALVGTIYAQVIVGAVMRHLHAGLAIPDFPLAFGRVIPPFLDGRVAIHFAHRAGALAVALLVVALVSLIARREPRLVRPALGLLALLAVQIMLGASVIWLRREPVMTSLHVVCGAAVLMKALLLALRATRLDLRSQPESASWEALRQAHA